MEALLGQALSTTTRTTPCHYLQVVVQMLPKQLRQDVVVVHYDDCDFCWTRLCQALAEYCHGSIRAVHLEGLDVSQQLALYQALFGTKAGLQQVTCMNQHIFPGPMLQRLMHDTITSPGVVERLQEIRILTASSQSATKPLSRQQMHLLIQAMTIQKKLPALRVLVCQFPMRSNHHQATTTRVLLNGVASSETLEQVEFSFVVPGAATTTTTTRRRDTLTTTRRRRGSCSILRHNNNNNHVVEESPFCRATHDNGRITLQRSSRTDDSSFTKNTCSEASFLVARQEHLDWILQCNHFRRRCHESLSTTLGLRRRFQSPSPGGIRHHKDDHNTVSQQRLVVDQSLRVLQDWYRTAHPGEES